MHAQLLRIHQVLKQHSLSRLEKQSSLQLNNFRKIIHAPLQKRVPTNRVEKTALNEVINTNFRFAALQQVLTNYLSTSFNNPSLLFFNIVIPQSMYIPRYYHYELYIEHKEGWHLHYIFPGPLIQKYARAREQMMSSTSIENLCFTFVTFGPHLSSQARNVKLQIKSQENPF